MTDKIIRFNHNRKILPYVSHWKWCSSFLSILTILALIIIFIYISIWIGSKLQKLKPEYQIALAERIEDQKEAIDKIYLCPENATTKKSIDCAWIRHNFHMQANVTAFLDAISIVYGIGSTDLVRQQQRNDHIIPPEPWFCGIICNTFLFNSVDSGIGIVFVLFMMTIVLCTLVYTLKECYWRCQSASEEIHYTVPRYVPPLPKAQRMDSYDDDDDDDDDLSAIDYELSRKLKHLKNS